MRRGFLTAVLSGALIGFCGMAFADTTDDSGSSGGQGNWRRGPGGQGGQGGYRRGPGGQGGYRRGPGGPGGGRDFRGGQRPNWAAVLYGRMLREGEIQAKFPKEYEAAAKQMLEAEAKLRELAKKAKVELPADNNSLYRELRFKDPAGFAEVEKLLKSPETSREGMEKMRTLAEKNGVKLPAPGFRRPGGPGGQGGFPGGDRDGGSRGGDGPKMRDNNTRQIRLVREKFPDEFKKFRELQQAGKKQEADELLRDLMRRVAPRRPAPRD